MKTFTLLATLLFSTQAFAMGSKPVEPTPPPPVKPDPPSNCSSQISRAEWQAWADNIKDSGGRVPDENAYAATPEGFKQFLAHAGASGSRAAEMTVPAEPAAAKKCGLTHMLPNRCVWIRGAALALWADRMAKFTGATTKIRNWNRPSCYNSAVGGASGSDHIQARSIDLYFSSATTRRNAQHSLCGRWAANNMQVGMGGTMLHIGFQSPGGRRFWYYASYADNDRTTNCYARGRAVSSVSEDDGHEH